MNCPFIFLPGLYVLDFRVQALKTHAFNKYSILTQLIFHPPYSAYYEIISDKKLILLMLVYLWDIIHNFSQF